MDETQNEIRERHLGIGVFWGTSLGVAIGAWLGVAVGNLAWGIGIGISIGTGIGIALGVVRGNKHAKASGEARISQYSPDRLNREIAGRNE